MFPLQDSVPNRVTPIATILLIAANVLVYAATSRLPDPELAQVFDRLGVVPAHFAPDRVDAAALGTVFSGMFLHAGFLHLFANMWTLWIFGPNVEERTGPIRFVLYYLVAGTISAAVHVSTNGATTIPAIGASGAISGVMGAYLVLYPTARILFVVPILFYPLFFDWPAATYLLLWFALQVVSGGFSLVAGEQVGGVAWWAHVGGFVGGILVLRPFLSPPRHWAPPPDYGARHYRGH
ncbi:MAG: rhomboid family intramembrane serine protease [Planctomycetota bacterium]